MDTRSKVQLIARKNGERKLKKYAIYGVGAALVYTAVVLPRTAPQRRVRPIRWF